MLSNMRLGPRLGLGFGMLLLLLVLVGSFALYELGAISNLTRMMYNHPFTVSNAIHRMTFDIKSMNQAMDHATMGYSGYDVSNGERLLNELEEKVLLDFKIVEERFLGDKSMYQQAEILFRKWKPIREEIITLVRAGKLAAAQKTAMEKDEAHVAKIVQAMEELNVCARNKAAEFFTHTEDKERQSFILMAVILCLATAIGIFLTIFITRSVTGPAGEIADVAMALSRGELTRRITYTARDEIGQMAASLRRMLAGVIGEGQSIKNAIPILFWTADTELTITFLNPVAGGITKAATGFEADQIISRMKVGEAMQDEGDVTSRLAQSSLESGERLESETRFLIEGDPFYFQLATAPLRDLDGKIVGVMGMGVDITERKWAEAALKTSEETLRLMFDQCPIGMALADLNTRILKANPELCRFFGYTEEELAGLTYKDLTSPEDMEKTSEQIQALLSGEIDRYQMDKQYLRKDGTLIWGRLTASLLKDTKGEPLYTLPMIEDITPRKQVEEALEATQKTYHDLFEQAVEGIYQLNPDGGLLRVNPALADIYGYETPQAMLLNFGEKGVEALRYDSPDRCREFLYQLWENSSVADFESEIQRGEGEIRWISENARLVRNEAGEVRHIEGFVVDITERKQAVEAMRDSAQRYRTVFDSVADTIQMYDFEGHLHDVNRAGCERLGYDKEKLLTMRVTDLDTAESAQGVPERMKLLQERGQLSFEVTHRCRDGSHIDMEMNSQVIDLDGKPMVFCVGRDVTERKQAESELRESETRFRQLAEHLEEVFWLGDMDDGGVWHLLYVNPALEKVFGITPEQAYASNSIWQQVLHEDDRERVMEVMASLDKENPRYDIEYRIRLPDGSTKWIWGKGTVIEGERENVWRTVEVSQDITQRHEMERRTALTQKLESIGQLAAGIAHEINTPTQYVGDNTRFLQDAFKDLDALLDRYAALLKTAKTEDLLREATAEVEETTEEIDLEFLKEEIPKAIEQSLEGVERVASIVLAMKKFSHPESEEKKAIDINAAIENTVTVTRNEWKYVAEMATDLDRELPLVPCFPGDFNQVVLNMVVNAAHAIAAAEKDTKKKGLITLSTARRGDFVEIGIRDTGTGIPEDDRPKIFDPFFTTKEVGRGTGQGLAIAHDIIVEKHCGSIRFETEINKGTEFIISLPLGNTIVCLGRDA